MSNNVSHQAVNIAHVAQKMVTELYAEEVLGRMDWTRVLLLHAELTSKLLSYFADQIENHPK
jgi:hypothetical protein